ncbi:MAG: hypothetical protein LBS01_02410 [Prevotellaceae bacterium]|jgi:hypothetical protein|nr:hypothetical protein [Prevotellaceae bacterium]
MGKNIKFSKEMQAKVDELGLKPENIVYLPIAQRHLKRIVDGSKKVEFRERSAFYQDKFYDYKKEVEKPVTHILFQGGYNPDSPRVLIEFIKYGEHVKNAKINSPIGAKEAEIEGFTLEDEYIGLILGEVVCKERI